MVLEGGDTEVQPGGVNKRKSCIMSIRHCRTLFPPSESLKLAARRQTMKNQFRLTTLTLEPP